ncbi:hypothetical protein PR048_011736 [Dryococelus australis]|uniref:PH domain-containing protein n=1 Tax=Dryococelus australis TaxID=614101 RepID=A0ABQ9HMG1_9NEOP|nr:hypothetical protein PR048_011736 [Dryococelus australis]
MTINKAQAALLGTILTCENPGVPRPGIQPGSPWWETSSQLLSHRGTYSSVVYVPEGVTGIVIGPYILNSSNLDGGRFFFNAVREGDSILYASDDENECHLWVMAMYRATGQSHKPTPPITPAGKNSTISKIQGAGRLSCADGLGERKGGESAWSVSAKGLSYNYGWLGEGGEQWSSSLHGSRSTTEQEWWVGAADALLDRSTLLLCYVTGRNVCPQLAASLQHIPVLSHHVRQAAHVLLARSIAHADRARKHGMEEFISADPCKFDHAMLFKMLQTLTLDYRLSDPYCSLVWALGRGQCRGCWWGKGDMPVVLDLAQSIDSSFTAVKIQWLIPLRATNRFC